MQVWIIDFGSQYTQLILKKTRTLGYSCELLTWDDFLERKANGEKPNALILSGGPQSIFEDENNYSLCFDNPSLPVFGICYGMQIMAAHWGGNVERGIQGEYGTALVHAHGPLRSVIGGNETKVWMSHFDHVVQVPIEFEEVFSSVNKIVGGMLHKNLPLMGVQFHPEVQHTTKGIEILRFFYEKIAGLSVDWNDKDILDDCLDQVAEVKGKKVLCAFSGGVDSLVAAALTSQVIGDDLHCFFIDTGLLRPQDLTHIENIQNQLDLNIVIVDAAHEFLGRLSHVTCPEKKRKIIGHTFIEVFDQQVTHYQNDHNIEFEYLLQGTLYPDVIESISPHKKGGKSVTIKSHHNVGGLPEKMNLKLLEPLRLLFKAEVRKIGERIGLGREFLFRHPFPGPGLAVRILGDVNLLALQRLRKADDILYHHLKESGFYDVCWQAAAIYLPVKTVGVKGDGRAYEDVIALRLVNSDDAMTAEACDIPVSFLKDVGSDIVNKVDGVTRVVYDLTSKPPGTIEWE